MRKFENLFDVGTKYCKSHVVALMASIGNEKDDTLKLQKLKGLVNWPAWKIGIKYALIKKELRDYVLKDMDDKLTESQKQAWIESPDRHFSRG